MNMKKCSRIFEEMIDRRERNIFLIHSVTLYIEMLESKLWREVYLMQNPITLKK